MLIMYIENEFLPLMQALGAEVFEPIMLIVITLAGIVMVFGAVGIRISQNLGSTIMSGLFRAIGYLCRTLIGALGWCLRHFITAIPRVYSGTRRQLERAGANVIVSNLVSIFVTVVFIVVII